MTRTDMIRWEPFLRNSFAGRFNQLFDSSSPNPSWRTGDGRDELSYWTPAVDIRDNGSALVLEADLPGFKQQDIDIRVENNVLVLTGQRQHTPNGHGAFLRSERPSGVFTRSFALPTTVDHSKFEATYRDGVLTLTMPKTETALPRRIDVKVN